jgi:PhzF family phenazine biosynthesis protein|tara:strand:- start:35542 stop:36396 length:855 start_codon:yes stop_codon:yes gene_type:complete
MGLYLDAITTMSETKYSPYRIINAFTDGGLFSGNPAAVCPLNSWPSDAVMQLVAAQNNLAETTFLVPTADSTWRLRWFTPPREVELCGHATLAAARVLFDLGKAEGVCHFDTLSGRLSVKRDADDQLWMDFPLKPVSELPLSAEIKDLFPTMIKLGKNDLDYLIVEVPTADDVSSYIPDDGRFLAEAEVFGFVLTAIGDGDAEEDFVSRFFAPQCRRFRRPCHRLSSLLFVSLLGRPIGEVESHRTPTIGTRWTHDRDVGYGGSRSPGWSGDDFCRGTTSAQLG